MKKNTSAIFRFSVIFNLILLMNIFLCSIDTLADDSGIKVHEKGINFRLSHSLKDYIFTAEPAKGNPVYEKTINSGVIIFRGIKLIAPITITYDTFRWTFNGFCEWTRDPYPYREPLRYDLRDEKMKYEDRVLEELCQLIFKTGKNLPLEEFDENLQAFAKQHDDVIEYIKTGSRSVEIKKKSDTSFCVQYVSDFNSCGGESSPEPENDPKPANNDISLRILEQNVRIRRITGILKTGNVCFIRPFIAFDSFRNLDTQFITDIDAVISKYPNIDFNKPAGDYLNILNEIIDVFKTYQLQERVGPLNIEKAAIILANWNRDPAEVLKEARARAEAKEGAGLVNGR